MEKRDTSTTYLRSYIVGLVKVGEEKERKDLLLGGAVSFAILMVGMG